MIKYKHNIPLHILLGGWTLLYMIPFLYTTYVFIQNYSLKTEIFRIIFYSIFSLSVVIISISSCALIFRKIWSVGLLSLGLHLFVIGQILALYLSFNNLRESLFNFAVFTFPIFPIILLLHSAYFIEKFNNNRLNVKDVNQEKQINTTSNFLRRLKIYYFSYAAWCLSPFIVMILFYGVTDTIRFDRIFLLWILMVLIPFVISIFMSVLMLYKKSIKNTIMVTLILNIKLCAALIFLFFLYAILHELGVVDF